MTEQEWFSCDSPFSLLQFLDGQIDDREFMRLSVAFCRSIWHLITDERSRAIVDMTEQWLNGQIAAEVVGEACGIWHAAHAEDQVTDAVDGNTHEAIEMIQHLGSAAAVMVSVSCHQAVGYAASRMAQSPEARTAAWTSAATREQAAQCTAIRQIIENPFRSVDNPAT